MPGTVESRPVDKSAKLRSYSFCQRGAWMLIGDAIASQTPRREYIDRFALGVMAVDEAEGHSHMQIGGRREEKLRRTAIAGAMLGLAQSEGHSVDPDLLKLYAPQRWSTLQHSITAHLEPIPGFDALTIGASAIDLMDHWVAGHVVYDDRARD